MHADCLHGVAVQHGVASILGWDIWHCLNCWLMVRLRCKRIYSLSCICLYKSGWELHQTEQTGGQVEIPGRVSSWYAAVSLLRIRALLFKSNVFVIKMLQADKLAAQNALNTFGILGDESTTRAYAPATQCYLKPISCGHAKITRQSWWGIDVNTSIFSIEIHINFTGLTLKSICPVNPYSASSSAESKEKHCMIPV